MSGREEADMLLCMARKDYRALVGMSDAELFDDEIFGFHAQQTAEKCLKAIIAALNHEYPLTHDLSLLLSKLEQLGHPLDTYWELVDLNFYAVRFRYEPYPDSDEAVDRRSVLNLLSRLVAHVEEFLGNPSLD